MSAVATGKLVTSDRAFCSFSATLALEPSLCLRQRISYESLCSRISLKRFAACAVAIALRNQLVRSRRRLVLRPQLEPAHPSLCALLSASRSHYRLLQTVALAGSSRSSTLGELFDLLARNAGCTARCMESTIASKWRKETSRPLATSWLRDKVGVRQRVKSLTA